MYQEDCPCCICEAARVRIAETLLRGKKQCFNCKAFSLIPEENNTRLVCPECGLWTVVPPTY